MKSANQLSFIPVSVARPVDALESAERALAGEREQMRMVEDMNALQRAGQICRTLLVFVCKFGLLRRQMAEVPHTPNPLFTRLT